MNTYKPSSVQSAHIPALDGLRGLAILMVIAHHYCLVFSTSVPLENAVRTGLRLGWCGVDLFFTLSGFLITGILLDSKYEEHYFARFFWRRAVRIFPIYYLFLLFVFVVVPLAPSLGVTMDGVTPAWYLVYLQNWKPNHGASDPFLGHTWSLSVEEQFYLVWPFIIRFCSVRVLRRVCVVAAALAFGIRLALSLSGTSVEAIYRLGPCRMDALALGALMAIFVRTDGLRERLVCFARWIMASCIGALGAILGIAADTEWEAPLIHTVGMTVLAVLFSTAVFYTATTKSGWMHAALINRGLRAVGKYSYAMYILHMLPNRVLYLPVKAALANMPLLATVPVKCVYMVAVAGLVYWTARFSWVVVESRFLKLKDHAFGSLVWCPASDFTTAPLRSRLRINISEPRALASGMRDGSLAELQEGLAAAVSMEESAATRRTV